jgi:hypothetical protein
VNAQLFHELALLDQSYHEILVGVCATEQAGATDHRVGGGSNRARNRNLRSEVHTRARAGAGSFATIRAKPGVVDWAYIHDRCAVCCACTIRFPGAGEWSDAPTDSTLPHAPSPRAARGLILRSWLLHHAISCCDGDRVLPVANCPRPSGGNAAGHLRRAARPAEMRTIAECIVSRACNLGQMEP